MLKYLILLKLVMFLTITLGNYSAYAQELKSDDERIFNCQEYKQINADLSKYSCIKATAHWVAYGIKEGRRSSNHFSIRDYLEIYPDLNKNFKDDYASALNHFRKSGYKEGRVGDFRLHPDVFDCKFYQEKNIDLSGLSCLELQRHWINHGIAKERLASKLFNFIEYKKLYPDLVKKFSINYHDYFKDYITLGPKEGRIGSVIFHPKVFNCQDFKIINEVDKKIKNFTCKEIKEEWFDVVESNEFKMASFTFSVNEYEKLYPYVAQLSEGSHKKSIKYFVLSGIDKAHVGRESLQQKYFLCDFYKKKYFSNSEKDDCLAYEKEWMLNGMRLGRQASAEFSIQGYIANENPILEGIFQSNYKLAWDYYLKIEKNRNKKYRYIPVRFDEFNFDNASVLSVDDYIQNGFGAKEDAYKTLRKIIADIKNFKNKNNDNHFIIKFGRGSYVFKDCNAVCINLKDLSNVQVLGDGKDTTLLSDGFGIFVKISNSKKIMFKDLNFDYVTSSFVQGKITKIDKASKELTIRIDNSFKHVNLDDLQIQNGGEGFGIFYDPINLERKFNSSDFISASRVRVGRNTDEWIFTFEKDYRKILNGQISLGDRFAYTRRLPGESVLQVVNNTDIGIDNVVFYNGPLAMALVGNSGKLLLNKIKIQRKNASSALLTMSAGGINAQLNRSAIELYNSYFEGMGDDALNIYSAGGLLVQLIDPLRIKVVRAFGIQKGDLLQFVDPFSGKELGQTTVAEINSNGFSQEIVLNEKIVDLNVGFGDTITSNETFKEYIQKPYRNTVIYNLSASGRGSIVKNNIIGPLRRSGMLIKAPEAQIVDNDFLNIDVNAILSVALHRVYAEGPLPKNQKIMNNYFIGGKTQGSQVEIGQNSFGEIKVPYNSNLTISDNVFIDSPSTNIELKSVDNVTIFNNHFLRLEQGQMLKPKIEIISNEKSNELFITNNFFN